MTGRRPNLTALGRHSPRLQRLRRIVAREDPGLSVLDGVKLIVDAAAASIRILEVYGTEERLAAMLADGALAATGEAAALYAVDESVLQRLAPTRSSQGVLAVVELPRRPLLPAGVVVYLADVQDPGNVGGIIRSASAFGASGVACSPLCADPFSPRALRASAGCALLLPVATGAEFEPLASAFRAAGGEVAATAGRADTPLADWRPRPPVLVVLGNEGQGVPGSIARHCDVSIYVPISSRAESLNVTVAAGIVLHALAGVVTAPILE